jgi:hypothetical protein
MKRAAIGIRTHSGWGAVVAVANHVGTMEIVDRRRIAITVPGIPGANQPYHFVENLPLQEAETFLENCRATSERLALSAIDELVGDLRDRKYRVVGSAVLLASGRPLPPLSKILVSHALIHAAEGEFFRKAFWKACEGLGFAVTGFRERDLDECAQTAFGTAASRTQREISALGRALGPPWTQDQKAAALAGLILLAPKELQPPRVPAAEFTK